MFEEINGIIRITFFNSGEKQKVGEKVGEKISDNQRKILKLINEDRNITIRILSQKVNIAEKNIQNNLKKLKEKGFILRVGAAKGGYWKVLDTTTKT